MKPRWRRALIGFGIVVGVAYLYLFVFGAPFVLTKRDFKNPVMWKVPAAIPAHANRVIQTVKLLDLKPADSAAH